MAPPLNARGSFCSTATGLGFVHNTIGSSRQIQMSVQVGVLTKTARILMLPRF
jgi:hypothetical protein